MRVLVLFSHFFSSFLFQPEPPTVQETSFCDNLHKLITVLDSSDFYSYTLGYVRRDSTHHADVYNSTYAITASGKACFFIYNQARTTGSAGYEECVVDNLTLAQATVLFNDYFAAMGKCEDSYGFKMVPDTDGLSHASNEEESQNDISGYLWDTYLDIYESDDQPGKYGVWISVNF